MKNVLLIIITMSFLLLCACEEVNKNIHSVDSQGQSFANIDPPLLQNFSFPGTTEISIVLGKHENAGSAIISVSITKVLSIADLDDDPDTGDPIQSSPVVYTVTTDVFTQSLTELFADVPIDGNVLTEDDLDSGDSWTLSYVINILGNTPTASNMLLVPVETLIPFVCISEIPTDGTWLGETQGGAFGVFSSNSGVVLTKLDSEGNYSLSDVAGGFYETLSGDQPANINDLCNIINVVSASDAQFAIGTSPTTVGSWNPVTEVLIVPWYDAGNDFEEITIFTRE